MILMGKSASLIDEPTNFNEDGDSSFMNANEVGRQVTGLLAPLGFTSYPNVSQSSLLMTTSVLDKRNILLRGKKSA